MNIWWFFAVLAASALALDNGLARTPPIGWSSWLALGDRDYCDTQSMLDSIDALVDLGLKDALGMSFVMISDCWEAGARTSAGMIQANASRFPNGGLDTVISYAASKGLRTGLYLGGGTYTCVNNRPGIAGHMVEDATFLRDHKVGATKTDHCFATEDPKVFYKAWSDALNATLTEPSLTMMCEWGSEEPWTGWGGEVANTYRVGQDHFDQWESKTHGTWDIIMEQVGRSAYTGTPGSWGYMDMIYTGLAGQKQQHYFPGQTETEYLSELSMWIILQSPLVWSIDVRNLTSWQNQTLLGPAIKEAINDINQPTCTFSNASNPFFSDVPWCAQADTLLQNNDISIWGRVLPSGTWAVAILNSGSSTASVQLPFTLFNNPDPWGRQFRGLNESWPVWSNQTLALVRDVWTQKQAVFRGAYLNSTGHSILSHQTLLLKVQRLSE